MAGTGRRRGGQRGPLVLGVDVGGVLVDRVAEGSDTSFFGDHPMDIPQVDGAFDEIASLARNVFDYRVHIVSKAGPKIAGLTREWLGRTRFFEITGISAANVWFVRKRPEKDPICRRLGVTHFVDDRLDVLQHLDSVEHRYLFTGGLGANPSPVDPPRWASLTKTWAEVGADIRLQIEVASGGVQP